MESGRLLCRSIEQIRDSIDEFLTIEKNSKIIACAGLREYSKEKQGEIYALVINSNYYNSGLSDKLINMIFKKARLLGFKNIFAVSKYGGSFFIRKGFENANVDFLPIKRQKNYDYKRLSDIYIKYF